MSPRDSDFASLAHDLSQLLWAIQGRARILAAQAEPALSEGLASIADDAAAAAAMLSDDAAGPCRSDTVLAAAWRQVCDRAGGGAAWRLETAGPWPLVVPPAHAVRRILGNLLANAVEAMPSGGAVRCEATVSEGRWRVLVRDDGPGIPETLTGSLFQPGATAGKADGHGLGLSGARHLARDHGGELAHVPGPGGAAFELEFPVADPTSPTDGAAPRPEAEAGSRPARLLVVDDDPSVRLMLQEMLSLDGHITELATDHQSALAVFAPGTYDAVLIDLGLPGRSGLDLARDLRGLDAAVTLILLSGWGREQELAAADPAVIDDTGVKPIDQPDLRAMLARAVERTAARRDDAPEA